MTEWGEGFARERFFVYMLCIYVCICLDFRSDEVARRCERLA